MSITALLDRLGTILPKYFIISAFVPTLIFGFLNGAIAYEALRGFRHLVRTEIASPHTGYAYGFALVALAVCAYLLSTINSFLREILEGKRILNTISFLTVFQQQQRNKITTEYRTAHQLAAQVSSKKSIWVQDLIDAAVEGINAASNIPFTAQQAAMASGSVHTITALNKKMTNNEPVRPDELERAVGILCSDLKAHDIRESKPLQTSRTDIYKLFDYYYDYWTANELMHFSRLRRFGVGEVAPTALGNVAASMQAYGITRYGIDLETYWSRLQPVIAASNKDFGSTLLDAKAQLDFLVACCWLSLFTMVWLVLLVLVKTSPYLFLCVAVGSPLFAVIFYLLAIESYVVFAELVRTGVDMYRFQLLQTLHLPLPNGLRDERAIWNTLRRIAAFGNEEIDISYLHDQKPGV